MIFQSIVNFYHLIHVYTLLSTPILFHLIDYHCQDFIIQVKVIVFNVFGVVYNYVTGNATTIHGMNTKSITRPVTILGHVHLIWG